MSHRIREAMRSGEFASQMGGEGGIVEADETYYGPVEERRPSKQRGDRPYVRSGQHGPGGKRSIVSLVERGGNVRTFHVAVADGETVSRIVRENVARESRLHTDESKLYVKVGREFATHETVNHTGQGIRPRRRPYELGGGLFLDLQARDARHLPALPREAPASLSGRVRFPLQPSDPAGLRRYAAHRHDGARARPASGSRIKHLTAPELRYVLARLLRRLRKARA